MLSLLDGVRTTLSVVAKLCIKGEPIAQKPLHSRFHGIFCNVLYQVFVCGGTVKYFFARLESFIKVCRFGRSSRVFTERFGSLRTIAAILEAE